MITQTNKTSSEFLTPPQLLQRWNHTVSAATLATWRSRGCGPPFVKIGGKVLYRVTDIETWENKNTRSK